MAAVARGTGKVRNVTPVGYEFYDKGTATEAILTGQLVKIGASGVSLNPAGGLEPSGIAIRDAIAGGVVEFARDAEIDGFTGLTPGTRLFVSASVAGGMDDTRAAAPANTTQHPRIEAVTATRIFYRT